jgi:acetylornithine deacetylase/succinyl-diaminopimelate desuccinylase-like protein
MRPFEMVTLLGLLVPVGLKAMEPPTKKEILTSVREYRNAHEHDIIEELFELVSIPNTETDRPNMRRNADFLKEMMERRGMTVDIIRTPGNPIVVGRWHAPNATQTIAFYAHYDGVPVDPSKWRDSEPFRPVLRPGKLEPGSDEPKPIPLPPAGESFDEDWRIYARSSSDDKSPIVAMFAAFDALKATGLPLKNNLKFVFEGEEEYGSTHFRALAKDNVDLLRADVLFICDGPLYYSGEPTLWFGVRGSAYMDITVYGANTDLHSGHFGNFAPNPAMKLARLLATMKDAKGRVTIEGFYDTAEPLNAFEQQALEKVPAYDETTKSLYGFSGADGGGMLHMETIQHPGINVAGLRSAWVGQKARVAIPSTATASLGIRLVKGNEPEYMYEKIVEHIEKQGFYVVQEDPSPEERMAHPLITKVIRKRSLKASRTSMELPISRRVIDALSGYFEKDPILIPSMGAGIGIFYLLHDQLGIPVIFAPMVNPDNNQHGPNENLRIGNLWTGMETYAALMMLREGETP